MMASMAAPESRPISLVMVASLHLMAGMTAVIGMGLALARGGPRLDFDIICLWSGLGLLRWSDGWRRFSVWWGALTLFWIVALTLLFPLGVPRSAPLRVFGFPVAVVSGWLLVAALIAAVAVTVWEIYVLSSRRICELFYQRSRRFPS
jgi:hypothetical protein